MTRRSAILTVLVGAALLAAGVAAWFAEVPYAQWETEDGSQRIVVRQRWLWSLRPVQPGDSGAAPGSIASYDTHTGRRLAYRRTPDVTQASEAFLNARGKP